MKTFGLNHPSGIELSRSRGRRGGGMRLLWWALLGASCPRLLLAATVTLQQGTHNYNGAADAWLDESYQSRNYGGSSYVRVQYNNGVSDCALLRFTLPSLAFQSLTAATLGLYYYDQSSMQSDNAVWITPWRITNGMSWYENVFDGVSGYGVNWRYRDHAQTQPWTGQYGAWLDKVHDGNSTNKIKRPGGSVPDAIEPPNWVTWDVRNSVAQWYAGQENNGFVLFESGFQGGGTIAAGLFYSREHSVAALRPYLRLTFQGAHIGWLGYTNSVWDTNSVNWNVGGVRGTYGDGDVVTFADDATAGAVAIASGGVAPGGIVISNQAVAYSFSGGPIGGEGGLTKRGGGQATLGASNAYTGLTRVEAGSLIVSADNALGSTVAGTVVSNGATLALQNVQYTAAEPLALEGNGPAEGGALRVLSGDCLYAGPIALSRDASVGVPLATTLRLTNSISGGYGLTKLGAGTLRLAGSAPNTYSGPTLVREGVLTLARSSVPAVPGLLRIGDGTQPATVRLEAHGQLDLGNTVTLGTGSTLDLNQFNCSVGSLSLSNATVLTDTGVLGLGAGGLVSTGNQTNLVFGRLDLGGATRTFNVANGLAADDLVITANLANGGVVKSGDGRLVFNAENQYAGETIIAAGVLCVRGAATLGKPTAGTVVSDGACLELRDGVWLEAEPIRLNGSVGRPVGALHSATGTNTCGGPIGLDSDAEISVAAGAALTLEGDLDAGWYALTFLTAGNLALNGSISGMDGQLTKTGSGTLRFGGTMPNTHSGPMTVTEGTLVLAKQTGPAIAGNLSIGGSLGPATTLCEMDDPFNPSSLVTVGVNGRLDLNGHSATLERLTLTGGTVTTGGGTLDLLAALGARGPADSWLLGRVVIPTGLRIQADGPGTLFLGAQLLGGSFIKRGEGRLVLTNINRLDYETVVASGTLVINNDPARGFGLGPGPVRVETAPVLGGSSDAQLGGSGSVSGSVTVQNYGRLNPGDSIGTLSVSNDVVFGPNGWLEVETDGTRIDVLDLQQGGDLEIQSGAGLELIGNLTGQQPYVFVKRARTIQGQFEGWGNGQPVPDQPGWYIHYGTQRIYFSRVAEPLAYFRALSTNGVVIVSWRTAIEVETTGFDLYRWNEGEGWVRVNPEPIPARNPNGAVYVVVDAGATPNVTCRYRLDEYASGGVEQREFERTPSEFVFTTQPRPVAGGTELRWSSRPDETYDLLGTADLNEPLNVLTQAIPATPPENVLVVPTNSPAQFFRVRLSD